MGAIKGRADDMLIIRGVNLFPTQVEEILNDLEEFSSHYQMVITKEGNLDAVEVKVEPDEKAFHQTDSADGGIPNISSILSKKIKNNIGLNMKITIAEPGSLPRSGGGKLSRVMDERGN